MSTSADKSNNEHAIEARLRRLEDLEAIRRLKHEYADLVDATVASPGEASVARLLDIFAEDAVADYGAFGTIEGRAALGAFFAKMTEQSTFMMHYVANPIIDVDGDRATARWYVHAAVARQAGGPAVQSIFGRYEDEYVRTPAGWKIQRTRFLSDQPSAGG